MEYNTIRTGFGFLLCVLEHNNKPKQEQEPKDMNGEAAVGGGGGGAGGDFTSIPTELRKTIQNIREITGKQHSDDDIYNMLTECSLDPDETAQKLLYLGKYHRANLFASMHLPAFPPLCIVSVR